MKVQDFNRNRSTIDTDADTRIAIWYNDGGLYSGAILSVNGKEFALKDERIIDSLIRVLGPTP